MGFRVCNPVPRTPVINIGSQPQVKFYNNGTPVFYEGVVVVGPPVTDVTTNYSIPLPPPPVIPYVSRSYNW